MVPYNPDWPTEFEILRHDLLVKLGDLNVQVEHVGSTAVPGLCAKPILDIDVVLPPLVAFGAARSRLEEMGYEHQGDLGLSGREAFGHALDFAPRHHLYVCAEGARELLRHLAFRDALRGDEELAARYGALKRRLSARAGNDRDLYGRGKTKFITEVLRAAL